MLEVDKNFEGVRCPAKGARTYETLNMGKASKENFGKVEWRKWRDKFNVELKSP